ncbi:hypothetical protein J5N97_010121 [Dioscorea zingiberensis]|uniref:Uncharacterized protein n=1 Tax=Dioscorea zingiberensis TaxID=325984 RepID=A0A9D5CYG5_9LILI|nr:hypothetical protein J5N97_010121 [Dioscorea zingiberensis]
MDVSLHDNGTSFPFFNIDEVATFHTQTPPMDTPTNNAQSESSPRTNKTRGKKRSMSNEVKAMHGMTTSVDKLAIAINTNKEVAMATNLANECKKLMQYGYTIQDVHRLFMKLNADNTKARGFLVVNDEMLRRLHVEEYIGLPKAQE